MTEMPAAQPAAALDTPLIEVRELSLWYGEKQALDRVSFDLHRTGCLAFIGPSGCGKTTALKCLNRMHDDVRDVRITGSIRMEGHDIHARSVDPPLLRRRFGWVAQKPNPFTSTIYENVAYGARLHGVARRRHGLGELVRHCLEEADLWVEVKDRLHDMHGTELSGGQQQRLCIARALSTRPDVLLMDEPTGSIDPISTGHVEELILRLKERMSIIVVTHAMEQAKRVADRTAFFHLGRLRELGRTARVFADPQDDACAAFIAGKYG